MKKIHNFISRSELDTALADQVSDILHHAIQKKGQASLAVSGGSTPKGFFKALSAKDIDWSKVTITLADERWVDMSSDSSNTRLVHENLLQNKAAKAKFFHLKQGETLTDEVLNDLNLAAKKTILPLDVVILGMGEDGHTASLFPCSAEITDGLSQDNPNALLRVTPISAPHTRISFTFACLIQSQHVFLHVCGDSKQQVLNQAYASDETFDMPIRAFLHHPSLEVQVYWAK